MGTRSTSEPPHTPWGGCNSSRSRRQLGLMQKWGNPPCTAVSRSPNGEAAPPLGTQWAEPRPCICMHVHTDVHSGPEVVGVTRASVGGGGGMSRMRPRTRGIVLGHEEEGRSDTCYHLHEPCKQDAEGGKLVIEATCGVIAFGETPRIGQCAEAEGRRRRWLPEAGEFWPAPGFLRDDENVLETDSGQLHVS